MAIVAEEAEDDILQGLALASSVPAVQPIPIPSAMLMETIEESDCADGPSHAQESYLRPSFSSAN